MSDPLGLSIGTTNLVAARVGDLPLVRRSVLPAAGQLLSGFVERVGDPVPLVADDGTSVRAEVLMVRALDAMVDAAAADESAQLAVAVPAHWKGATLRALRDAMRTTPRLAPNGTPARLVSDAVAALTALGANPGLPDRGVVVLLDFGGGGTSVTLADAAAAFEPIETTRLTDFAGDQIDQALLAHVLDGIAAEADPAGTAAVGSLAQLRDECRRAKEELSEASVADVPVDLPGHRSVVQITRDQLDELLAEPLAAVLSELDESLLRNRIALADVSAVVAVGGGASIPLVARRLSEDGRPMFVTSPRPALDAAVGAALFAAYGADADAQTGVAPTPLIAGAGVVSDGPGSATFRALAWSQDDDAMGDPQPYIGGDSYPLPYDDGYGTGYGTETGVTRAVAQYHPKESYDYDEPRSWQRLPGLMVGVAAVIALVAVGGVAVALTSATDETRPAPSTAPLTATSAPPSVPPKLPPPTSAAPPPPPVTEAPPPSVVTVTSAAPPPPPPQTVTVERPVTTTTTTTQPTTTTTTTTTTTPPTTTTTTTTESSTPTMTTSYITVPFLPVPIPIQVPSTANPYQPPAYQQVPQYQQQPQLPY